MSSVLIAIPLAAGVIYLALIRFVSRHAHRSTALAEFRLFLGLLACSSIGSVLWRLSGSSPASEWALRVVDTFDLLVAPTFLTFVAAQYHTRWARRTRQYASFVGGVATVGAVSGAVNRAVLHIGSPPALVDYVAGYGAVAGALSAYIVAAVYLVAATRRERDPFERNRRKYVGVASVLIVSGQLTNLVPALQQLPLDRGLNTLAALLIFYSLVRYRLFDADVVLTRSIVVGFSAVVVTPLYLAALFGVATVTGQVFTPLMFVLGIALVVPASAFDHYLRGTVRDFVDRLFLGRRYIDYRDAGAEFVRRSRHLHSTQLIADLVCDVSQAATESRFTAIFLSEADQDLRLFSIAGPDPRIVSQPPIEVTNALMRAIVLDGTTVTPLRQLDLIAQADVSAEDAAKLEAYRDCVIQPVLSFGSLLGLIVVGPGVYDQVLPLASVDFLRFVAEQAGIAFENARLFEQVQSHAETDFLTGLPNHRHLQDLFASTLADAEAHGTPFSVAMIDIDNFKLLNDTHGHLAGDEALRSIAAMLRSSVRAMDIVGRYGGDEFLFILPGVDQAGARELLARVMRIMRRTTLSASSQWSAAERLPLRFSWGMATYPENGRSARPLISAADSDLRRRRYVRRRSGSIGTVNLSVREFANRDPRRARIAAGLLDLLDVRDPYTTEHSQQVAALSLLMADELRLPEQRRETLWLGALLHDIGKITVREEILRKPGILASTEWTEIRQHPLTGAELLTAVLGDDPIVEIVVGHHERFDGGGYPRGLRGDGIPLLVRAVSVADAFSAMVHDRPYRKGLSQDEAVTELRRCAGAQFDPEMVELFVRAIRADDAASRRDRRAG